MSIKTHCSDGRESQTSSCLDGEHSETAVVCLPTRPSLSQVKTERPHTAVAQIAVSNSSILGDSDLDIAVSDDLFHSNQFNVLLYLKVNFGQQHI